MSIVIGLTKKVTDKDRSLIRPIISNLLDSGYVRHMGINDDDIVIQTFTEEQNEIMPAYMIDRIVKKIKK
jgi:hypothetical protein